MQNGEQKTGVIYCRVSSQEQVSGTSLAMQERLCKEYAQRETIEVLGCFVEEGESAKTADRTEFKKALNFCADKKHPVSYFIVHKLDRFARNKDDHVLTQMFLRRCGTKLRSVTEQIDETPIGKMMEGVLSTWAQFDNDIRASRSKSGMIEKTQRGIWVWAEPLGYKRLTRGGNLVVDDDAAPHIRFAFEKYAEGAYTFQSLAEELAKRGFRTRTGKKPFKQLIEKILRNPIYYGIIKAWGHEHKAAFAPIIEEELFWKCQRGVRRRLGHNKRDRVNPNFPLRRFTFCAICNRPLTGSAPTGRRGVKYPYYHHHTQECTAATFVPKETLEQNFVEYLQQEISTEPKYEKIFKAVVLDVWQSNYKRLDGENVRIRKEVEVLEAERQRVFDMHRAGTYSESEFLEQKNLVNEKIYAKKHLLQEKHVEEFNMEEALDYCFGLLRESGKTWQELEDLPFHRARFQKQVFPEKVTFDGEEFGTTKISMVCKINKDSGANKTKVVNPQGLEPTVQFEIQVLSHPSEVLSTVRMLETRHKQLVSEVC